MSLATEVTDGIRRIDSLYTRPEMTSVYLLDDNGEFAVVDPGAALAPARITEWFDTNGIGRDRLRYCFVTHAHLDHCAGTGLLLERFPDAVAVVQESAHPHIADPFDKLWAGAVDLYGEEFCKRHYSDTRKVDPARLQIAADGETFDLGRRALEVIHTPGHAWHHLSVHDPERATVIAGDGFGVSYREFDNAGRSVITPTAPPPQFNREAMEQSIRRIAGLNPERIGLAHYAVIDDPQACGERLLETLDRSVETARKVAGECAPERLETRLRDALLDLYAGLAMAACPAADEATVREMFQTDVLLNSKGLARWIAREREKAKGRDAPG